MRQQAAELFERHRGLAFHVLRVQPIYPPAGAEWGDVEAVALAGLWRASVDYDPSRDISFAYYACTRIWGDLRNWVRKMLRQTQAERPLEEGGGCRTPPWEEPDWEADAVLAALAPRQRCALLLRYVMEMTVEEIGAEMGITFRQADWLVRSGLKAAWKHAGVPAPLHRREPKPPKAIPEATRRAVLCALAAEGFGVESRLSDEQAQRVGEAAGFSRVTARRVIYRERAETGG